MQPSSSPMRSALLLPAVKVSERLSRLQDLFAWLRTPYPSSEECLRGLFPVLFRLTYSEVCELDAETAHSIGRETRGWDWRRLQRELREKLARYVSPGELALRPGARVRDKITGQRGRVEATLRLPALPQLDKVLVRRAQAGGRLYFQQQVVLPTPLTEDSVRSLLLTEVVEDLTGVACEAIGCCRQCGSLFVRRRAGRGQFCSARCRGRAAEPGRGKGKPGRPRERTKRRPGARTRARARARSSSRDRPKGRPRPRTAAGPPSELRSTGVSAAEEREHHAG